MIKFNFIILIYLIILLKIQCLGRHTSVEVEIIDDWKEKREFIYLKYVEIKDRFVMKTIEKQNNQHDSLNKNIEEYLRPIDLNLDKNMFEVEISDRSDYIPSDQLKKNILFEITNNEIIQNFMPGLEKMVLRNNKFIENNKYYETSILYKSEKNNNFDLIEENIKDYKNKILSSYWSEINLIGYKIELLQKQNVENTKELESRIIYVANKIREIIEGNKLNCFNCRVTQTKHWYRFLKEPYLCQSCHEYKIYNGKMRPEGSIYQNKMVQNIKL
uniref:GATA-type domain-containing protein n=1 Tax=Meloidogyne enterolobii TaxID=390850 RepID=A0A6V7X501_MELEN|nr:unnamed protein product [Meloidogyne enterolobii]